MKLHIWIATIVGALLLLGCDGGDSKKHQASEKELLFYCAAGIRPPIAELVEIFTTQHGIKINTDYAGSEVLLSKIKLTRRGDLYMPGDKHYIEQAANADMILSRSPAFYWVPTILVQKGNPRQITKLDDLLQPGLKLGVGDPNACAIGRTTKLIFAKNKIDSQQVRKHAAYQSLTVNELGLQIQARSLDAVIVWDAISRYYDKYGDQVPIDIEKNIISTVDIGVLKFTTNKELAEKFVDFITSRQGQEIFEKYNYSTKPPK